MDYRIQMGKIIVPLCKKTMLFGILGFAGMSTLCSAQELVLNCDTRYQVRNAAVRDKDRITLETGKGRSGSAFRIVCPKDQGGAKARNIGFHANARIKIESAAKPVRTCIYLKGKGRGSFGLLAYDKQRKIFYPGGLQKKFELDSPDKWTLLEFTYTPQAGSDYANKAGFVLPYISLAPGSDFLLDDWETRFIDANKEIVIEE